MLKLDLPKIPKADMPVVVTLIVLGLFALQLIGLHFIRVPVENRDTVQTLTGALLTGFNLALGYWIGSSNGSRKKDEAISRMTGGS